MRSISSTYFAVRARCCNAGLSRQTNAPKRRTRKRVRKASIWNYDATRNRHAQNLKSRIARNFSRQVFRALHDTSRPPNLHPAEADV